jgi:hypothetical protein
MILTLRFSWLFFFHTQRLCITTLINVTLWNSRQTEKQRRGGE